MLPATIPYNSPLLSDIQTPDIGVSVATRASLFSIALTTGAANQFGAESRWGFSSRMPFKIACDCTRLRFPFINRCIDAAGLTHGKTGNSIFIKARALWAVGSPDYGASTTKNYACVDLTFNGLRTVEIISGGMVIADELPGMWAKGELVQVQTEVWVTTIGQKIPLGGVPMALNESYPTWPGGAADSCANLTPIDSVNGIAFVTQSYAEGMSRGVNQGGSPFHGMFTPTACLGHPTGNPTRVLIIGDSISYNNFVNGTGGEDLSLFGKGVIDANQPLLNLSQSGDRLADAGMIPLDRTNIANYLQMDMTHIQNRRLWQGYHHAIVFLGANDLATTALDNLPVAIDNIVNTLTGYGTKVHFCTILQRNPGGTYTSLAGQTIPTWETKRQAVNTYIRNHKKLTSVIDFESVLIVQSGTDRGKWVCPGGVAQTSDGTHLTAVGQTLAQSVIDPTVFTKP